MTYEQKIASRIKEARIQAGLSQRELARKLGVTGAYVSYLEKGQRNLDVKLLKKIADLTEMHPLYFFGRSRPSDSETGKSLFLKSSDAAVITDDAWKVLDVNKKFEKLTGFKKEEVIGRQFESWHGRSKFTLGLIPPKNFLYNVLNQDLPLNIETRLYTKTGPISVNMAYIIYKNKGKQFIVRLIRKLKRPERYQTLKRYLKKLQIDESKGIVIIDAVGGIINLNKEAEKLLGYKKEEIFHINEILFSKKPKILRNLADMIEEWVSKRKILGFKTEARRKSGSVIPILTDLYLLFDEDNKREGGIIVFEKI